MVFKAFSAAVLVVLACAPALAQDTTAGALVFKRCAICHTLTPGSGAMIGPNLKGVVGRLSGSVPKYSYSPAMQKANLTWDKTTLDRYLAKPAQVVPGNKMAYGGLFSAKDRADLIAFLITKK
jgi:cytochrome c